MVIGRKGGPRTPQSTVVFSSSLLDVKAGSSLDLLNKRFVILLILFPCTNCLSLDLQEAASKCPPKWCAILGMVIGPKNFSRLHM